VTPKERAAAVFEGREPDQVPLLLDLSHWYKKNYNIPFDLSGLKSVDAGLVELHKELGAVSYVEMGSFYDRVSTDNRMSSSASTKDGVFTTRITTPEGSIHEERVFNPASYSYTIRKHLLDSVEDFKIVRSYMESLDCVPCWERYSAWEAALGELFFGYCSLPYSGLGYLISRNYGVEKTIYSIFDYPDEVKLLVDSVNSANLRVLEKIIDGPFSVLIISDNFDSTVQTKELFDLYSRVYYTEVANRLHAKGKYLAVHVDGEMRGALTMMRECGVDCIDAATPAPMFSLTPAEARKEAGNDMILSGGIPPTVFGVHGSESEFIESVISWLETRKTSSRLLMAAGDQVPPDASIERIRMVPDLVSRYGKY
jgi:hypothetical protein